MMVFMFLYNEKYYICQEASFSMFRIPEGLGLVVLGLTTVQVKFRDILDRF